MASYHCSIRMLSRSSGRSSVQFSAYISAEKMKDERIGKTFSHTSKEEVCYSEILFTERVPNDLRNAEKFWNEIEAQEKQSNAQVARTFEIALPHELTIEQNQELAKEFAKSLLDDGIPAVQFAVHQKDGNWHAHFITPTRDIQNGKWQAKEKKVYALDEEGNKIPILDENGNQKFRERKGKGREMLWERKAVKANIWNDRSFAKKWRERVASQQNEALEKYGYDVRVDHRSYAEQGIEKIPQIHEGYGARQMEQEGNTSERCQHNREVAEQNALLEKITAQIKALSEELHRKGNELNERIEQLLKRREATLASRRITDRERETSERERTTTTEHNRAERFQQLLERRERENAESIGTLPTGQRETASSRSADPDDKGAREIADILRATEELAQRKQREALEAERARKAAQLREQQLEAERERARKQAEEERARSRKSHETSRGFSR